MKPQVLGWTVARASAIWMSCVLVGAGYTAGCAEPYGAASTQGAAPATTERDRERDAAIKAIEDAVARETIEESVRNLWMAPLSHYHCDLGQSSTLAPDPGAFNQIRRLYRDPRVAKLCEIARDGSDEDRRRIRDAIVSMFEEEMKSPAVKAPPEDLMKPSMYQPNGAIAYPLVLVHADPSVSTLPLLLRAADYVQDLARGVEAKSRPTVPPEARTAIPRIRSKFKVKVRHDYLCSPFASMIVFGIHSMLGRYVGDPALQAALSPAQQEALGRYRDVRDKIYVAWNFPPDGVVFPDGSPYKDMSGKELICQFAHEILGRTATVSGDR